MEGDLGVTLLQAKLARENPGVNREKFEPLIFSFCGEADLVILPEMFTTGFIA